MTTMTIVYPIRFTPEQLAQLRAGAEATCRPVANFVRWAATRAAREALAEEQEQSTLGGLESVRNETET